MSSEDHAVVKLHARGLSRETAAIYVGVSASLFDQMVADGRMPTPKTVNRRKVWDRHRLDAAFDALPDAAARTGWEHLDGRDQVKAR